MRLVLNPFRMERWFGEEIAPVIDLIRTAERVGFDAVGVSDHVVMGDDLSAYPYTGGLFGSTTNFHEPVVYLAVIAAHTKKLQLSMNVLLAPLRPAALLAKQLATLDFISGGRLEPGFGVGWQKAEYDAEGVLWDGRFGHLVEIVQACKTLWKDSPATFRGRHVSFERVHCRPFPPGGMPVFLGIGPSKRNIERLAQYADGWSPLAIPTDVIRESMFEIKARMAELGRDASSFRLRFQLNPVLLNGKPDLDATLAEVPKLIEAGCTDIEMLPILYCAGPDDYQVLLHKCVELKHSHSAGMGC